MQANNNYPDKIETVYKFNITSGQKPERVDVFLTRAIAGATRNRVQKAIDAECVRINGKPVKASRKIQPGDEVECVILKLPPIELIPEPIPIEIVYEDEHLVVVNKQRGLVVHPSIGHRSGTLINALLYHFGLRDAIKLELDDEDEEIENDDELTDEQIFASDAVRPGLVHRIDKDTSGLLVVAKNAIIHAELSRQFAEKTTEREYQAIIWGSPKQEKGTIIGNIGRSPKNRKLFTILPKGGKYAKTDYEVLENYKYVSLARFQLHTGRTHQIRVHSHYIGHPIFGDPTYGGTSIVVGGENPKFRSIAEKCLKIANERQILHAKTLGFYHPALKQFMRFDSPLPEDFRQILELFRNGDFVY
ncbi:MAG TPA: RluA family pseudouridine synthase [Candidatus Kapabacteria bacterium]|jgi:23S rRNA pseudouridine1911/1915/1917 synthase|nr:RluA family pseudouridine synthase [Candidatus Kapabacteria bacterium]HPU22973.1 RluA family pseudouridine synthase [Candidatus Kapabacteria bacterium]